MNYGILVRFSGSSLFGESSLQVDLNWGKICVNWDEDKPGKPQPEAGFKQ
jgi:hypothetical protein